jgi:radical SAM protein with 4Fe4S-binding SPASM domain
MNSHLKRRVNGIIHRSLCALAHKKRLIITPIPPYEIFIEISAFCNLRCPTCPQSGGLNRPKGNMDISLFAEVIDQAKSWASQASLFLAGEPLIYPNLHEALKLAHEAGLYTRIHTNGLLLDKDRTDIILKGYLDELSISLDGPTREHYEKIRVGGDFEKCLSRVKGLIEEKRRRGLNKPKLIVQSICLKGEIEKEIEEGNKKLLNGLAYDEIKVIPAHSFAGFYKDYIRNIEKDAQLYNSCGMLYNRITVLWDGKTPACCNDFEARYITGDVHEKTLQEIWNDEPYRWLRRSLRDGNYEDIELCRDCDVLWSGKGRWNFPIPEFTLKLFSKILWKNGNNILRNSL